MVRFRLIDFSVIYWCSYNCMWRRILEW